MFDRFLFCLLSIEDERSPTCRLTEGTEPFLLSTVSLSGQRRAVFKNWSGTNFKVPSSRALKFLLIPMIMRKTNSLYH